MPFRLAADPIMYYAFSWICIDFSIQSRVVFQFCLFGGREGKKRGKKNRGISLKNQYLKYLFFFSVPSSCDVCAGVITHSAGYVWFSIQFRLSKTSGVFAFPPFTPFDDLWARLLFTYSFQFKQPQKQTRGCILFKG